MQFAAQWVAILTLTIPLSLSKATECHFTVTGSVNGSNYIIITEGENVTITGKVNYTIECSSSTYSNYLPLWYIQSDKHPKYKPLEHVPTLQMIPSAIPQSKILPFNRQLRVQYFNLMLIEVKREYKFIVLRPGIHVGSNKDVMAKSAVMVEVLPKEPSDATTDYSEGSETPTHSRTTSLAHRASISSSGPTRLSYGSPAVPENKVGQQVGETDEEQTSAVPQTTVANNSREGSNTVAIYILLSIGSVLVGVIVSSAVGTIILNFKLRKRRRQREQKPTCNCEIHSNPNTSFPESESSNKLSSEHLPPPNTP